MSVDNFKTNIYEYLETLPTITFMRLFEKPATCLAIFRYFSLILLECMRVIEEKKKDHLLYKTRLLPSLGRQIVMSLLYMEASIPVADIHTWVNKEGQK